MHTTACDQCRTSRLKCVRPSKGYAPDEVCDRCRATGKACHTRKRTVGRQPGVRNLSNRSTTGGLSNNKRAKGLRSHGGDEDNLPNPLNVLTSTEQQSGFASSSPSILPLASWDLRSIVGKYSSWTEKLQMEDGEGVLVTDLESAISGDWSGQPLSTDTPVFFGRTDMARPDVSSDLDVIALQVISLSEAEELFEQFMNVITNGAMTFDPKLHTLGFVRSRSSFLLAVILYCASSFVALCPNRSLHLRLRHHTQRLETHVRTHSFKSVEIVQAFLCLACFAEVPSSLSQDQTWNYVSYAIAIAMELRLDLPQPHCVLFDPLSEHQDLLLRNAHRACFLLFIHDRNMAMVAGRYPLLPETSLFGPSNLLKWGKHESRTRFDASLCASVSLRRLVTHAQVRLASSRPHNVDAALAQMEQSMGEWRSKWAKEIQASGEYEVIAGFSRLILSLSISPDSELGLAARACDEIAFQVCCTSIGHYNSWPGLLNSATFDTSMVAFCAVHVLQSVSRAAAHSHSDWHLYQIAVIRQLVKQLRRQAQQRHTGEDDSKMSVVDAMARQVSRHLHLLLNRTLHLPRRQGPMYNPLQGLGLEHLLYEQPLPSDVVERSPLAAEAMPFISEWNLDSLFTAFTNNDMLEV